MWFLSRYRGKEKCFNCSKRAEYFLWIKNEYVSLLGERVEEIQKKFLCRECVKNRIETAKLKCLFCEFYSDNQKLLLWHMRKTHGRLKK